MIDHKVRSIVTQLSNARGANFFETIVQSLADVIDADHTFVAELSDNYRVATTIAYAQGNQLSANFSYDLAESPCADVCNDTVCLLNGGVQSAYPNDHLLVEMGIHSYVGAPLLDSTGKVQGIIVALYKDTIDDPHSVESLFLLFSGLISGELERLHNQRHLNINQSMIDALNEGVILTNEVGEILYVNPAFTRICGYSNEEALGQKPGVLLNSGAHDAVFYRTMWKELNTNRCWSGEVLNRKKSGETYSEWLTINKFTEPVTGEHFFLGIFHDISELKNAQEKIYQRENFDLLTKIPNRQLFIDRVEQALITALQTQRSIAVLVVSLDNFRDINVTYGHSVGDKILQEVANRLSKNVVSATVARIGGDEFSILIPTVQSLPIVEQLAIQLTDAVRQPFLINDHTIDLSASIGITIGPSDSDRALELIAQADQASDYAKTLGKAQFHFYTPELQTRSQQRFILKKSLKEALKNRELQVYYQPIIHLPTRRVEKCEALVRWEMDGTFIPPDTFIPIAEEFRLVGHLGRQVLEMACQQALALQQHDCNVTICVNRSVQEFSATDDMGLSWLKIIADAGLSPSQFSFEITESLLAPENHHLSKCLHELQRCGCQISLDDFGTGYSSLSYLRNFPIDFLKIDRSFIADMENNEEALLLVSSIVAMAKALKLKTVAEGVETVGQLNILTELGCEYIQGYYFSRPLPGNELIRFLKHFHFNPTD